MILSLLLAIVIGLTLGLIGGGGSILTVPVLVYVAGVPAVEATAASLFVVGLAALVGSLAYVRRGEVRFGVVLTFGIPSIVAVYLTRRLLVPRIPEVIGTVGEMAISRDFALMVLFALLMVLAAVSMIRSGTRRSVDATPAPSATPRAAVSTALGGDTGSSGTAQRETAPHHSPVVVAVATVGEGLVVGTLTGLVGAGGGFLIVPALVMLAHLPMKSAIGTSLMIIAIKSLIGFLGDLGAQTAIDWYFLGVFAALTIVGIVAGSLLAARISAARLKPAFGWFVLVMGAGILVRELIAY
jgi:uncharacterized membrane protein YfcA